MLEIFDINELEYKASPECRKLPSVRTEYFFYKINVSEIHSFYLSSSYDKNRFINDEINGNILFCADNRVFVFSKNGAILLLLNVFEELDYYKIIKDFIFIFSEKGFLKITTTGYYLYDIKYYSDFILEVIEHDDGIEIKCFDEKTYKYLI